MITKRCPKCGGKLKLIGTIHYPKSTVHDLEYEYRRRRIKCLECGFRFNTYEIREEDFKRFVQAKKNAHKTVVRTELAIKNLQEAMDRINNDNQS